MKNSPSQNNQPINQDKTNVIKGIFIAVSITCAIFSIFPYLGTYFVMPQFREMLNSFGADLPYFTLLVLNTYHYFSLFYFIGLIPCIILCSNKSLSFSGQVAMLILSFIGLFLSLTIMFFIVIAMYLPLFKMGAIL